MGSTVEQTLLSVENRAVDWPLPVCEVCASGLRGSSCYHRGSLGRLPQSMPPGLTLTCRSTLSRLCLAQDIKLCLLVVRTPRIFSHCVRRLHQLSLLETTDRFLNSAGQYADLRALRRD
jgi:hypothetical protein